MRRLTIGLAALGLIVGACTASTSTTVPTINPSASHAPVTITLWSFFTERELKSFNQIIDDFHQKYSWITINSVGAKDVDDNSDIKRAINSGLVPDVVVSPFPQDVARFCATGGWQDLNPSIKQDHIAINTIIPPSALSYSGYKARQCSLPMLSDAYGLYYNVAMLQKAGYTSPPTTISQFTDMAKKLTEFNPDGSIKVAGFVPLLEGFYENAAINFGHAFGAQWYDASGTKSALGTDPRWAQMLQWQKSLVDWYGYDKLQRFYASLGGPDSEWSASQGFETGKIAMTMDGEWRVAFIADDKAKIDYGTAPFPAADSAPQIYGSGQIGGNTVGLPKGSQHPAEGWLLLKWLATDTQAQLQLANLLKNVPTTLDALKDPQLANDPHFDTFMKIFANPQSAYKQQTPIGDTDQTLFKDFINKWQAGKVSDLAAGLQQVAKQIDDQNALG